MSERSTTSRAVETRVLLAARRRCCLCYFLHHRDEVRKGQIAHLNQNPADSRFSNLVWLCLEHHDEYDSRTSQAKGITQGEVVAYRNRLYAKNKGAKFNLDDETQEIEPKELEPLPPLSDFEAVRRAYPDEFRNEARQWRYPLWQVANRPDLFAYKASNRADGICLIERIDLPDGYIVIACINVAGNPGCSITNSVESICFQVCERFEIPPSRLIWLEHYDEDELEEWNWVTFAGIPPDAPFTGPTWTPMTAESWRRLRLKPKKKLTRRNGEYQSKLTKQFNWPCEAIDQ